MIYNEGEVKHDEEKKKEYEEEIKGWSSKKLVSSLLADMGYENKPKRSIFDKQPFPFGKFIFKGSAAAGKMRHESPKPYCTIKGYEDYSKGLAERMP